MRDKVVAAARSFIGTRWRHRGRNRLGLDCVGLLVLSRQAAGLPVEDQRGYGREPWNDSLRTELCRQFGEPIPRAQWAPGDIALFHLEGEAPRHIGILGDYRYGGLSLIHAHSLHGVAEQSLESTTEFRLVEVYACHP